jgi:hypothetical protein
LGLLLNGGRRSEIDHPTALIVREGVAVFLAPGGVPILFGNESINQVIVAPAEKCQVDVVMGEMDRPAHEKPLRLGENGAGASSWADFTVTPPWTESARHETPPGRSW